VKFLAILVGGTIFGFGLAFSGMSQPEVVLDFLKLDDLGLILVMGGAIAVTMPVFQLLRRPLLAENNDPFRARADGRRLVGSVCFGIGWGIAGVCPGAAFASLGTGNAPVLLAVAAMFLGAWVQGRLFPDRD
jgi:uncharacterized protein